MPTITNKANGGRTAHPCGAAVELQQCSTSLAGSPITTDGLRLDDEVADQLLHAWRTPWTQGTTGEVKDSHACGLHELRESWVGHALRDARLVRAEKLVSLLGRVC